MLIAQNYAPVAAGNTQHYASELFDNLPETDVLTVTIDSTALESGLFVSYYNKILRYTTIVTGLDLCEKPNILGNKTIETAPGNFCIIKHESPMASADSIFIDINLAIGTEWKFNATSNNSIWWAHVTDKSLVDVLGNPDSVITFVVNLKDSIGNLISHPTNNTTFKLSKSMGFVQLTDLQLFPEISEEINLIGSQIPFAGAVIPNVNSIFNYSNGDEFHYTKNLDMDYIFEQAVFTYKLNNQNISGDTLYLTWLYNCYKTTQNYITFDTILIKDSILLTKIPLADYAGLNKLPLTSQVDNYDAFGYSVFHTIEENNTFGYCSKVNLNYDFITGETCTQYNALNIQSFITFANNIGLLNSYATNGWQVSETNLVYYKNLSTEWGTPVNIPDSLPVLSVDIVNTLVNDNIVINSDLMLATYTVNIFDATGKMIMHLPDYIMQQGNNLISCKDLIPGYYIISLASENKIETFKFIKIRP